MEWRGGMVPHIGLGKSEGSKTELFVDNSKALREIPVPWNQYRGPNRDGHIPKQGTTLGWQNKPSLRWKVPNGPGHSSVLIGKQTVYTLEQNGNRETLFARQLSNGQEKWKFSVKTKWNDSMSGIGPRSTPTLLNGKLYTLFTNGVLCRLNEQTGKLEWKTKVVDEDYAFPEWGIVSSPFIWKDSVILNLGGKEGAVRAYSISSGKLVWKSDFSGESVYISSSVLSLLGEDHLLAAVEGKIAGLDPNTGKTRWERPWKIFLNNVQIAQPIALSPNSFLFAAGYGKGAECFSINRGANPDTYSIGSIWKSKNLKAKFSNPVLKDGYLYGLSENLLVCLEAETGELKWRGEKYGYGRILASTDKLFILGNTGILSVVEANPEQFTEVFSEQLLSDVRCWNGPALAGGYLVAMNGQELACFDWANL